MKTSSSQRFLILLGACLFQCAIIGVLANSSGVLLAQIRTEYNLSLSQISTYHTLKGITGALGGALITTLFFKMKKPVFMSAMIIFMTASYLIFIAGAEYPVVWWIAAVLNGVAFCTHAVMIPFVLLRHFPDKPGTATGIAMAFSGLGGIVFNPLTAWLIERWGWRSATWVLSVITFVMAAVALVLLFPRDANDEPAAQKQPKKKQKVSLKDGFPMKKFLLCNCALLCISLVMQFNQYVTMFAQDVGYSLQVGATLTSVFMIGNVGGKLLFGYSCDKIGVYRTMTLTMGIIALGSLLLVFFSRYLPVLYVGILFYGLIYSLSVISVSRCAIETYGAEGAQNYMGLHTSINGMLQALGAISVGVLYDATGSFSAQLLVGVGLLAFSAWACMTLQRLKRKEAESN